MIEVVALLDPVSEDDTMAHQLARIRISKVEEHPDGTADYVVEFGVDRARATVGAHRRRVENFPRLKYNVLALLSLALQTLDPEELSLEHGTAPSDLAWRQRGTRPALPR